MSSRVLCFFAAGVLMAQTAPPDAGGIARAALDRLLAQKYSELQTMLAPQAKAAYSEASLAKMGADIQSWGAVQNVGAANVRKIGNASIVAFQVKFATQNITFQFSVTEEGAVAVMLHSPPVAPWAHPAYSKPDSFKERDVTVGEGQWKLPGTLTVPVGAGPFPGVVLVHASGPGDRDESIGAVKVFRDLAEGLASRGVVVLRYEKRTRQYPQIKDMKDYTVEKETLEDAGLALAVLRAQPEVKPGRAFLLGYGLGGYVAPRIAEADGKLAGMVIVNANARPLEDVTLDEANYLQSLAPPKTPYMTAPQMQLVVEQAAKIKKLTQGDVDTAPLLGMLGPYLLDLQGYNPAGLAKLVNVPILVLQGERDFEATMKDFSVWKAGLAGQKNVAFKSYPSLDRVLVAGQGPGTEVEERKPGQHVAPDVIDDLGKWLNQ